MPIIRPGDILEESIANNGEQSLYNFNKQGHTLLVIKNRLTAEKISGVTGGTIELALYTDGPVLFLLYKFNNEAEWDDAPFSWHRGPYEDRVEMYEDFPAPFEYAFRIVLAEASSKVVKAVREFKLDESFAISLHNIILRQSRSMFNAHSFIKHLNSVYNGKTPDEMAELAEAYFKI